jgi:hypothetical protein
MFEIITKINIIFNLIKFLREYRFFTISILLFFISTFVFAVGFLKYNDNSIYADNNDDTIIKQNVIKILTKCGDKNAMGVSTISTVKQIEHNAKFKEIYSCDFLLNKENCIVDLSTDKFKFAGDYVVDLDTYNYINRLASEEEILKIYLPEFDYDEFTTIKELLEKSQHLKDGKYLFLTAVENYEKKLIYIIHFFSWSETNCPDIKYMLDKFRKKLPIKK